MKNTIDLGTTNLGIVDTGVHLAEGQMTTQVNKAINMGTKVLPPVTGSTVNLGTLGTTQITTTTTTNQTGFGVEGPGLGIGTGAVGYGTTSVDIKAGASATGSQFAMEGAGFGVEGSGLPGTAVGYGTTSIERGQTYGLGGQTTTTNTTTTTSAIGGGNMATTLTPSFLPNAFNSVQPEQIDINNQPLNA